MTDLRKKWLPYTAMACVGLLVADRLVLTPLTHHWQEQGTRIAELRESLERGTLLLEREDSLRDRWTAMRDDAIPADASAAENEVLKAAARWARDSRILLTGMVPQWRKHKSRYETLECRINAEGDLTTVTRFLRELETDPLAVRLEACEITAQDDQGRKLTLSARFSALRVPTPEKPAS